MDATTELISSYAVSLDYSQLPISTVHETKRRIIDALGCALGGYDSEPATIARRLASMTSSNFPSRVLGNNHQTSPEMAAFANTVMVRYLDFNDTFVSPGAGHPSDMFPAVLAVADPCNASGSAVITATVLAYEIYGRFADQVRLADLGWDQGIFAVIGSACAAGKVLCLSEEQMAHAISLAVIPNLPLSQTRVGELSMWKGCATANASRNGVFAALLAKEGIEGPDEPFEGHNGLWNQATGPVELEPFGGGQVPFKLNETSLKQFPSQIHTQVSISLALQLRQRVKLEEIQSIILETYHTAWRSAGSDPEKWDPKTRETADHSLPYLISVAFADGQVTTSSYTKQRISDPALRPLMEKVRVRENSDYTLKYPEAQLSRMEVVTKDGRREVEQASYPKGHRKNPVSDEELENKFCSLTEGELSPQQSQLALELLWKLEEADSIGQIFDLFRIQASK